MRWRVAVLAAIGVIAASRVCAAQHTLQWIEENGPSANRIDTLVLGDGYTAGESGIFLQHVATAMDELFATPPFHNYRQLFNIAAVISESAQSGADHPSQGLAVDTAFGCGFDCFEIERLICCDDATVMTVASEMLPGWDMLLLIVNDPQYGGSGGLVAVVSADPYALQVLSHEYGHTLAMLGDEYEDPYPGFIFQDIFPNVSVTADRDDLKWAPWVEDETPLPTPESAATGQTRPVGAYEGACYQSTGYYRPAPGCLMRSWGNPFCDVCHEALVIGFWQNVSPIDGSDPGAGLTLAGAADETLTFTLELVQPDPATVSASWTLDGAPIPGEGTTGGTLTLPFACLEEGPHELVAVARDGTSLVRNDVEGVLADSAEWRVTRTDDGAVEDCGWPAPDTDGTDPATDEDAGDDAGVPTTGDDDDGCGCQVLGAPHGLSLMLRVLELSSEVAAAE